jgi:hypothetical protein
VSRCARTCPTIGRDYRAAVDGYEFACAVLRLGSRAEVSPGEFLRKVGNLITEFTRKASEADDQWPWWTAINSPNLQTFAAELTETLKGM